MTERLPGDVPLPLDLPEIPYIPQTQKDIEDSIQLKLVKLQNSNKDKLGRLMSRGRTLHPLRLIQTQIKILAELALDETERVFFELEVEQAIAEMIQAAEREADRADLTQLTMPPGSAQVPGLILPGQ